MKKWVWVLMAVTVISVVTISGIYICNNRNKYKATNISGNELLLNMIRQGDPRWHKAGKYWVREQYTENLYFTGNEVKGVVLHHTAAGGSAEDVANTMCRPGHKVSCHVVIDKDGTRYVLAEPTDITWHAGYSKLGNRFKANEFTIGIEFHGNTLEAPLTDAQIESAIEYLKPIIKQYKIPAENIVTHQMIRDAYRQAVPSNKKAWPKVDITPEEYERVLKALKEAGVI
ncbi:MAG: N-acetylmuramoyl-L-alanine amidase [Muribaculaceae bacterium]|nr:N-acetylmuramoyl-L-alanine amidase [Muribaculaceae bacterium]